MAKAAKKTTSKEPVQKATAPKKGAKAQPFTDTHEHCKLLNGILKIVDVVGNIIEDIPQAWRHGKSVTTAETDN